MPYSIENDLKSITDFYASDRLQQHLTALILGTKGAGKTTLATTGRLPVHYDSFDPAGTVGLSPLISEGKVVADTRFEHDDPLRPTAYALWKRAFTERFNNHYFDQFGTYVLDSYTVWSQSIMNSILMANGRPGQAPMRNKDYMPLKTETLTMLRMILNLPCDILILGHLDPQRVYTDAAKGEYYTEYRFKATGDAIVQVPILFSEQWVLEPSKTTASRAPKILTHARGVNYAVSRLAGKGLLNAVEEPDLKAILKKVGFKTDDLPLIKTN